MSASMVVMVGAEKDEAQRSMLAADQATALNDDALEILHKVGPFSLVLVSREEREYIGKVTGICSSNPY